MKRLLLTIFLFAIMLLSGCGREDVSKTRNFPDIAGTTWKTKVPLMVAQTTDGLAGRECTEDYAAAFAKGTAERNAYGDNQLVVAVFPIGTLIRIEKLYSLLTEEGGTYVESSIRSGPYNGKTMRVHDNFFVPNKFLHPENSYHLPDTWAILPEKMEKVASRP